MISLHRKVFLFVALLIPGTFLTAQIAAGLEFQAYPAGLIPGIRAELPAGERGEVNLRLGYQIIDHQDFGVQDDETGNGLGGSLGYRFYFQEGGKGFFGGIRTDIWFNTIDWVNNPGTASETSGQSKITVLQPTAEAGYRFALGASGFSLAPAIGFGLEWNVATEGLPTGEGPILLGGLSLMYQP